MGRGQLTLLLAARTFLGLAFLGLAFLGLAFLGLALFGCSDDTAPIDASPSLEGNLCASCTGCCAANRCLPGNTISACGAAGLPCNTCLSTEQCLNGICVPAGLSCSPSTCGDGCCSTAGVCMRPPSSAACGLGGAPCSRCGESEVCLDGRCQLSRSERYAVRLYSAVLDSFCDVSGLCDPYAEITLGDDAAVKSPTLDDTDTPLWDFKVLEASLADLTRLSLSAVIKDEDYGPDGTIGECTIRLEASQVTSGAWSGVCGEDVPELVLHFAPSQ